MRRRESIIKSVKIITGLIFVPELIRAQVQLSNAQLSNARVLPAASGGGGGTPTAFITGGVSGSDDGYAGDVNAQSGFSFTPSQAMTVTDMGAFSWPGSFGTATLNLYDVTGCALLKTTTVDLSAHDSVFHYTSLGGGTVSLTSGHKYFIYLWNEVYKINTTPTVGGGSINDAAYNGCGEQGFGAGHASVGPNFKYT